VLEGAIGQVRGLNLTCHTDVLSGSSRDGDNDRLPLSELALREWIKSQAGYFNLTIGGVKRE
jgi:hypothetical protein